MSRKKEVVGEQFSNNFFAGDLVPTETPYGVVYSGPLGDEFLRKINEHTKSAVARFTMRPATCRFDISLANCLLHGFHQLPPAETFLRSCKINTKIS